MQKTSLKVQAFFDSWLGLVRSAGRTALKKATAPRRAAAKVSEPALELIWHKLVHDYFPDRLDLLAYKICWSNRRQKRTLASCNIKKLVVLVARELDHPNHGQYLEPLLYHELCHAVLGQTIKRSGGRRQWHGSEFKQLERRHPGIATLERWIKSGGWRHAVRSERSRSSCAQRRSRQALR